MKKLFQIDFTTEGRSELSPKEREKIRQAKRERDRQEGYEQLSELCRLGEIDAAKQLLSRNSRWGYEIIDGVVLEKLEDEDMKYSIHLDADRIHQLDLSPAVAIVEKILADIEASFQESLISFEIDYPREETDPRELSEIPEVRLWFLRLDTRYPWLPFLLDWKSELPRYIAMLVPHQFHRTDGIQYNPEALEIAIAQKTFIIYDWLRDRGIEPREKLKFMWMTVGYDLNDSFFEMFVH